MSAFKLSNVIYLILLLFKLVREVTEANSKLDVLHVFQLTFPLLREPRTMWLGITSAW